MNPVLLSSILIIFFGIPVAVQSATKPLSGYNIIVVEKVAIEKNPGTEQFADAFALTLQHKLIERLRRQKKLFLEVVDPRYGEAWPPELYPAGTKKIVLSTVVVEWDPGTLALREYIGLWAGAMTLRAKFIFRDPLTNEEKLTLHATGKVFGNFLNKNPTIFHKDLNEACQNAANNLIKQIKRNR